MSRAALCHQAQDAAGPLFSLAARCPRLCMPARTWLPASYRAPQLSPPCPHRLACAGRLALLPGPLPLPALLYPGGSGGACCGGQRVLPHRWAGGGPGVGVGMAAVVEFLTELRRCARLALFCYRFSKGGEAHETCRTAPGAARSGGCDWGRCEQVPCREPGAGRGMSITVAPGAAPGFPMPYWPGPRQCTGSHLLQLEPPERGAAPGAVHRAS